MAEPARGSAADQAEIAVPKPDPMAPGWADVRDALVTEAAACRLAVEELASRPDDDRARALAGSVLSVLESLGVIARRWVVDEAVIEAWGDRRYAEGVADCKAARRRLEVIGGG